MISVQTTLWVACMAVGPTADGGLSVSKAEDAPTVLEAKAADPRRADDPAAVHFDVVGRGSQPVSSSAGGLAPASADQVVKYQRRTGRIVAGSVLTGVGAATAAAGVMCLALGPMASFGGGEPPIGPEASLALAVGGGALLGVGIPTMRSGFKRLPVESGETTVAATEARVLVGPRSVALSLRF